MSKLVTGLIFILIAGLIIFLAAHIYSKSVLKTVSIAQVDPKGLPDGTYSGTAEIKPVVAKVDITIVEGKISDVQLIEHQTGLGKKAETLTSEIIEKQSLQVDAVSGATMSSQAILKAAENALTNEH
ncbi:hypothetical protein NRIC_10990 [Enterococcus florum]|uniref:FMN-binding domain-containing protein n=1 Tax=Enterococcus florum TaxID=2480627 RepID=A0A4P5PB92_9ENTE|nr:FMN-binding protein [Enterococcus florum]GCF93208.1 hypothetical protein NRIC_10990 [Enterococcus florum]